MVRTTLDGIIEHTRLHGPRELASLNVRLTVDVAEAVANALKEENIELEAFDFPNTRNIWSSIRQDGVAYKHVATKQLVGVLAERHSVDYRTVEGFRQIIGELTWEAFKRTPINAWGTTLAGMLAHTYGSSVSAAVLDLVDHDEDFFAIRMANLQPYDFPGAPKNSWSIRKKPTATAREATKRLIQILADGRNVDYRTVEGFRQIIGELTWEAFKRTPINAWGTTLSGMLSRAYADSPSKAVLNLMENDAEFKAIKTEGLQPYDFLTAPKNIWFDKEGKPAAIAHGVTKRLIQTLAEKHNVDYRTVEGFRQILRGLTKEAFKNTPINSWGTTLERMLPVAYRGSPSAAVLDLIQKDEEFSKIKAEGLQPYDFQTAPSETWVEKRKPTDTARNATKQLVGVLAERHSVDYRTVEGFRQILRELTQEAFKRTPINSWGTSLQGMLVNAYRGSPSAAVLDLVQSDPEFAVIKEEGIHPYDFLTAPKNIWLDKEGKPAEIARGITKKLIQVLAEKYNTDCRTVEGFKQILRELTQETFFNTPIDAWGTTPQNMLRKAYGGSISAAVLDLIRRDEEFFGIREVSLKPYDFPKAPQKTWKKDGRPTPAAREATKQLIEVLAQKHNANYRTVEGFGKILEDLVVDSFHNMPINVWGTTLIGQLAAAYKDSPYRATLDLIENDQEFVSIRKEGIQPYDFPKAPNNMWGEDGKPTATAREVTKQLIRILAGRHNVDYRTVDGFKQILGELTQETFHNTPINAWKTTLSGMLQKAYAESPSRATLDLIENDPEFAAIKTEGLQPYDFPAAPNNFWVKDGRPTQASRDVTKQLINVLAQRHGVDYRTVEGFGKILEDLIGNTFQNIPINAWGTTLGGMLATAYRASPADATLDLIKNDNEFRNLRGKVTRKLFNFKGKVRGHGLAGTYSLQTFRNLLTEQGFDLSDYGFYHFGKSEKQTVREILAEEAHTLFGSQPITYFGLEGPSFGSYFSFAQLLSIDTKGSLVPERDPRSYNAMMVIKRLAKINGLLNGNSLSPVELVKKTAEKALEDTDKTFNLIFLDWLGHISPLGTREMDLSYERLRDPGMIAITVNKTGLAEQRFKKHTGLAMTQDQYMTEWAHQRGMKLGSLSYVGGDKAMKPMALYMLKS